jgi:hypothetical protein
MNAQADTPAPTYDAYPLDFGSLIKLFLVGMIAGVLGWLLYLAITQYFILPVFCNNPDTFSVCRSGGTIAWVGAHIVVMAAAVAVLARFAVYRPLLVVLGVLIALWGAHSWLGGMPWYIGMAWQALLFGLAMAVFGWIARTNQFIVALIVTLIVAVLARVILMYA